MESRLKQETTDVKDQLGKAIGDLGSRVERTERRLDDFAEEVNLLVDRRLATTLRGNAPYLPTAKDCGVEAVTADPACDPSCAAMPMASVSDNPLKSYAAALVSDRGASLRTRPSNRSGKNKEENYWQCRRALRLRPIAVSREGNDIEAVTDFMRSHLKLDDQFLDSLGPFSVRRIPAGPGAKVKGEAVVTFDSVEASDAVRRSARNLAGKGQEYGIRLELPNHLKTAMSALQAVSYEIKQKFPGSRRNVLFDDDALDLVLDFSTAEGQTWRRMTSQQARDRKKKSASTSKFALESEEIDALLDGGDEASGP